jgi:hypothetical protein
VDSSHVSAGPFLLAEIGGESRAALSLTDGAILADPFYPTAPLVQQLVIPAQQVGGNRRAQKRRSRWAISGRPGRYRTAKPPPHRGVHDTYRPHLARVRPKALDRAGLPRRESGRVDAIPSHSAADPGRADCRAQGRLNPRAAHLRLRSASTHRCDRAHADRAGTALRPTDRTDHQPTRSRSSDPLGSPLIPTGANHGNGFVNSGVLDTNPHTPNPSEVADGSRLPSSAPTTSSA